MGRILRVIFALTLGLVGSVVPVTSGSAAADSTADVTVTGVVRTLAFDTAAALLSSPAAPNPAPNANTYRRTLQVGEDSYLLTGTTGPAHGQVRATGVVVGREFRATSVVATGAIANAPSSGNNRILVMLAYWTRPDSVTQATAASQMFTDSNAWFREVSYGRLTQSGDVTPWMPITGPATGCYTDGDTLMSRAKTAATARGYDLAAYSNYVLYFPNCGGDAAGFAGWAYVGSTGTWLNGYLDRRVTTHELGHNLGLWHSHSNLCSGGGLAGTCSFSDYGDDYDAMGASTYVAHYSASQKALLGWLDGRLVDLSAGGRATLAAMSTTTVSTPQAAVVSTPSGRRYWLEYRRATGVDAALPGGATNGVLVHVTGDGSGSPDTGASLIDVSPDDGVGVGTATLQSGQTWTSPDGFWVSVGDVTAVGATVTTGTGAPPVSVPGVPASFALTTNATARSATISWAPPPSSGGAAITGYRVARDGTDSGGGGPWSAVLPATARSQTFNLLVPGTAYTLTVQAVSALGSGAAASGTARIITSPGTPTHVAATKDTATASATLAWAPPTTTGGSPITGYRVTRSGLNSAGSAAWTATLAATARSQSFPRLVPGTAYTFTVQAINAAGTGTAASVITVLTTAPGTPSHVAVTQDTAMASATLTWAPPTTTGGSPITGYRVTRSGLNSAGSAAWTATLAATARSQSFPRLVPGTAYTFTVQAINAAGTGTAARVTTTLPVS